VSRRVNLAAHGFESSTLDNLTGGPLLSNPSKLTHGPVIPSVEAAMRRVRYHSYGDPDVLVVEEADVPQPGPGQVLIRAEAIGANFVDTKVRRGPVSGPMFERPLPAPLTGDVVGTVEAVGEGVAGSLVGRRVATLSEDAFADRVVADAAWLADVPAGLGDVEASMLPLAAPIALRALRLGRLGAGETVLVDAAAGGIGHLAVQMAKLLGAGAVIGGTSGTAKHEFVRGLGADAVVDYSRDDWPAQVRAIAPDGVDVFLDSAGGSVLRDGIDVLAPLGRAVAFGLAEGDVSGPALTSLFAVKSVTGFSVLAWRSARPDLARKDVEEAAGCLADGRLRVALHARLPLTEAAEAHRILEGRANLGRVLMVP